MDGPQIIVPVGMMGAHEYDSMLDRILREIAEAASPDPKQEWAEKYGTHVETPVFAMHPYCWCDREDCPWCVGCDCDPDASAYFIDDERMPNSGAFYDRVYDLAGPPIDPSRTHVDKAPPTCDYCTGAEWITAHGGVAGNRAPNFWHRPTGLKVWWYKYIGRGTEIVGPERVDLVELQRSCIASLADATRP
jgi:hypothetical protein